MNDQVTVSAKHYNELNRYIAELEQRNEFLWFAANRDGEAVRGELVKLEAQYHEAIKANRDFASKNKELTIKVTLLESELDVYRKESL